MQQKQSLSPKQLEYLAKSNHRWGIKVGAVRSGKTYLDTSFLIMDRILDRVGKPGLNVIFGVSSATIERNVLCPMRERYGARLIGAIRSSTNTVKLFGTEVYCIGVEKANSVGKIQGMGIKYAYGDEIGKWSPEAFAMIASRLDKECSQFDGTCNPDSPSHWFKKWLDKSDLDAYVQEYTLFDNPFLSKSFVQALCNEYAGTVYYDRYILGKWALAEGLIYPMYVQAFGDLPDPAQVDKYVLSIDYGTENPFAAILWAHCAQDSVWYAMREYYYSGRSTGAQKTDSDYVQDVESFSGDILAEYRRKYESRAGDSYANRQKLTTIVDPSAASFIAALRREKVFKVLKADNDVADGIRETAVAMKTGLIKVSPSMKNWRDEVEGYVWDEKSSADKPLKARDHLMDSMRYFVKTMKIVKPRADYKSAWVADE